MFKKYNEFDSNNKCGRNSKNGRRGEVRGGNSPTPTPTSPTNDSIHSYQSTSNFHFGGLTSITTPTM